MQGENWQTNTTFLFALWRGGPVDFTASAASPTSRTQVSIRSLARGACRLEAQLDKGYNLARFYSLFGEGGLSTTIGSSFVAADSGFYSLFGEGGLSTTHHVHLLLRSHHRVSIRSLARGACRHIQGDK